MKVIPIAALACGLWAIPAAAQEQPAPDPGSRQTREFVQAAGQNDTFEIMEATTAIAESKDPQVIGFAQRMIRDHTQTSQALAQATASAGLKPPPKSVGAANAPFLAALQSLRAREFDQGYWRQQMLAHAAALVVEQKYAATGDTPSVRQAAAAAVPVIQAHLTMAQQMASRTANGS